MSCIDSTLAGIKAALIYQGIDFRAIFVKSEDGHEYSYHQAVEKTRDGNECQYHEAIGKARFIELVTEVVGAIKTPKDNIQKLANFLRLN